MEGLNHLSYISRGSFALVYAAEVGGTRVAVKVSQGGPFAVSGRQKGNS